MKKQAILYISIAVLLLAIAIFFIFSRSGNIQFNTVTHAEWIQNGYCFIYRGSKSKIRSLIIEKDGTDIGKFSLDASPSLFSDDDKAEALFIHDDDNSSLFLLPFSLDSDGDRHYRAFFVSADGTAVLDEKNDLINPKLNESGIGITCEGTHKETVGMELSELGAPYEQSTVLTVYQQNSDGNGIYAVYRISVTYYSESDIYCFSEQEFDITEATLGKSRDRWLSPEEYAKEREGLSALFSVSIP